MNSLPLSKEFLQNKILFPTEFHPLHHRVPMDATPFRALCPRCGPQLGPAVLTTLTARVLSACLCATSMVYLPDLRLIGTQEPAPPWLLHVIVFRSRPEIATAKEDCSLLPGILLQCPLAVLPSKSECLSTFSWCPTVQQCRCTALSPCYQITAGTVTAHTPQDIVVWG